MKKNRKKIIIILGPTAAGKTDISLKLAKKFNGFVISADSRQIYKNMDIGTSKPEGKLKDGIYCVKDIPHYLIDIAYLDKQFTLADWQKQATEIIEKNLGTPFIVGGTGLYISSLVNNYKLPEGEINKSIRKELNEKGLPELLKILKKEDPQTYEKIDKKNKRRVVRALEYILSNEKSFSENKKSEKSPFEFLQIGIKRERDELHKRIAKRVDEMLKKGLVAETKNLLKKYPAGLQEPTPAYLNTIGYQECAEYLQNTLTLSDLKNLIEKNTRAYAKRQLTWFKRDQNIHWLEKYADMEKLIKNFLKQ